MSKKRPFNAVFFFAVLAGMIFMTAFSAHAGYDQTAPILNSVRIVTPTVTKPGIATIELDVTEEDTGVAQLNISLNRKGKIGGETLSFSYVVENGEELFYSGKTSFQIKVPSSTPSDQWYVGSVYFKDAAGNQKEYQNWRNIPDGDDGYLLNELYLKEFNTTWQLDDIDTAPISGYLTIQDEFDVNFEYSISNPNITSKINSMPEGSAAMIDFTSKNSIGKKEWFDAIKGKDKKLVFSNDGIQWMINGKDITNATKNIDLRTVCEITSADDFGGTGNVAVISFADNGVLPGKARIRIKSDYILGTGFNLYFQDGETITLENSNGKGYMDGDSIWAEFYVTHNSTFILSKAKLTKSNLAPAPSENPSPTQTPVSTPGSAPAQTPVSTPGSAPAQTPVSTPGSAPAQTPVPTPDSAPAQTPVSAPASALTQDQTTVLQMEPVTISKKPSSMKVKVKKNKATVSWKKVKKTKKTKALLNKIKYVQVQYSTDPTFAQNAATKKVGKNKTKIILKLKKKNTYYVRVRYAGSDGFSNWTNAKKIKMK